MTYNLCWIVICCPISRYCGNIISESMEFKHVHVEISSELASACLGVVFAFTRRSQSAATTLLLWRGCLGCFRQPCCCPRFQWSRWSTPAPPLTTSSGGTPFWCWGCQFSFCGWIRFTRRCCSLTVLSALFFLKFTGFKCATCLFDPVANLFPNALVVFLSIWRVDDVCSWIFVHACQVHNRNKRSIMILLWGLGSRCSKTGIEH